MIPGVLGRAHSKAKASKTAHTRSLLCKPMNATGCVCDPGLFRTGALQSENKLKHESGDMSLLAVVGHNFDDVDRGVSSLLDMCGSS